MLSVRTSLINHRTVMGSVTIVALLPAPCFAIYSSTINGYFLDKEITVKGQPRPFAAGMNGVAEIVVGKRALISYVFEPIRQLRENLSNAP